MMTTGLHPSTSPRNEQTPGTKKVLKTARDCKTGRNAGSGTKIDF